MPITAVRSARQAREGNDKRPTGKPVKAVIDLLDPRSGERISPEGQEQGPGGRRDNLLEPRSGEWIGPEGQEQGPGGRGDNLLEPRSGE